VKEPDTHSKQKDPINSITTPDGEYGERTSYMATTSLSTTTHKDSHPLGDKIRENRNTLTPGA